MLGFTSISCIYAGWLHLHPVIHAAPLLLTKHPMKENQQLMYVGHIYPVTSIQFDQAPCYSSHTAGPEGMVNTNHAE